MGHAAHSNHGNHHNYAGQTTHATGANTGQPISLSWDYWPDNDLNDDKIQNSVDRLKELREQISYLQENKGWKTKVDPNNSTQLIPDNPTLDLSGAADSEFNDGDPGTVEYVEDVQYDSLREGFDALYSNIISGSSGLVDKNSGDRIMAEDFEALKTKIDELASSDVSAQYTNHSNHSSHVNYS